MSDKPGYPSNGGESVEYRIVAGEADLALQNAYVNGFLAGAEYKGPETYEATNAEAEKRAQRYLAGKRRLMALPDCAGTARSDAEARLIETADIAIDSYYRSLRTAEDRMIELRRAVAFFASVIKSGEPWTETCQQVLDGVGSAHSERRAGGGE